MSDFDIAGAKQAGYSDTEIADHLAKTKNFDAPAARKAGYSDADILGHLSGGARPKPVTAPMAADVPSGLPPSATPEMSVGGVLGSAVRHLPESAGNFVNALAQPFIHPIDTAKALGAVASGVISKTGRPGDFVMEGHEPAPLSPQQLEQRNATEAPADALGALYKERYGSIPKAINTFATDPVGFAADATIPLTGGGSALARLPGVVGRVGEVAQTAGRIVDPLTQAGNALKLVGKVGEATGSNILGLTTGAGTDAIRAAGKSGREGGEVGQAFRENMRGDVLIAEIVDRAKAAVGEMRQERAAAYKEGMGKVGNDKTVLDFQPIDDALAKAHEVGTYKGKVVNRSAGDTMQKVSDLVTEWKGLDPAEYHTPEGLDALKRTIGDLRDSTDYGTPARVAADRVYNAVRAEIQAQAPEYAGVMEAYSKASDKLKETTKTFSLGEKATGDTAARKLQSSMRNNVNTNFGERRALLDELAAHDPTLPPAIAGQSLNSLAPRGLVGRGGLMATGSTMLAHPLNALALPAFSPRLVGEAVHAGGRGAGLIDSGLNASRMTPDMIRRLEQLSFQSGRNALAGNQ